MANGTQNESDPAGPALETHDGADAPLEGGTPAEEGVSSDGGRGLEAHFVKPSGPAADGGEEEIARVIGALIDDVHRLFTRIFDRRMARLGLTRAQWRVLTFLFRKDGMTQSALADLLEMERAPLGRLLDRLEESGWVERRSDPGDKRAKRVFRTNKIDPLLPTLKADAHDVLSNALAGLAGEDRTRFIEALGTMKSNLQAADTGAAPEGVDSPAAQAQEAKPDAGPAPMRSETS